MKIKSFMLLAFVAALFMTTNSFANIHNETMAKTEMTGKSKEEKDASFDKNKELFKHFDKTQTEINRTLAKGVSKAVTEKVAKALQEHEKVVAGTLFKTEDMNIDQLMELIIFLLGATVVNDVCGPDLGTIVQKVECIEKLLGAKSSFQYPAISKAVGAACYAGCNRSSCSNKTIRAMCEAICCINDEDKIQHCVTASPGSTETCDNYTTTNPYPAPQLGF